jgi:putative restriction endonuclease
MGQGNFRANLWSIERACRVTKVRRPEHLVASHNKPWRDITNEERLDGEDGLLLTLDDRSPFDKGFISFEDKGRFDDLTDGGSSVVTGAPRWKPKSTQFRCRRRPP